MEETFADPAFPADSPFSETPASQQAAQDLRSAASQKATQAVQDATNKAAQIKQSAVEKAQQFRDFAGNKAHDLKETAAVKAKQLKQVAGEQVQQGRIKAREAHADAEEYIRQHPTKSVVTALGVGFVLGLLIRR
ncbi:MAG: DUF883 family protein [Akkermansiaceae bacterium]